MAYLAGLKHKSCVQNALFLSDRQEACPVFAQAFTARRRAGMATDQSAPRLIPRLALQNAPKKRMDITTAKVLVHISCAACHATVTLASNAVGACNENLSQ